MSKSPFLPSARVLTKILGILAIEYKNSSLIARTGNNAFLLPGLYHLKYHTHFRFRMLSCISCVDYPNRSNRFDVVYELLSLTNNCRFRLIVQTNETTPVKSSTPVYINANWWEREIFDMFGIFFTGHSDMRRLLTDYGFENYPLRKDFPLSGYFELRYDEDVKLLVNERLDALQEYRGKVTQKHSGWKHMPNAQKL